MIRYDFDFKSYYEGLHPVSHIHIGNKNQIRLGIPLILSPKVFLNFVLRQNYPAYWKGMIANSDIWKKTYINEKSNLEGVDLKFWNTMDYSEFYLT